MKITYTHWIIRNRAEVIDGRLIAIRVDKIVAFEKDDRCVIVHTENQKFRLEDNFEDFKESLSKLQLLKE